MARGGLFRAVQGMDFYRKLPRCETALPPPPRPPAPPPPRPPTRLRAVGFQAPRLLRLGAASELRVG